MMRENHKEWNKRSSLKRSEKKGFLKYNAGIPADFSAALFNKIYFPIEHIFAVKYVEIPAELATNIVFYIKIKLLYKIRR